MKRASKNLVIGIYFHPEAYPPTLNAIGELSDCFDKIVIVHRPHLNSTWNYPANSVLVEGGKRISLQGQQSASLLKKVSFFLSFLRVFYRECKKQKPACILVYDFFSLYAYRFVRPLLSFRHKVWYHNHDVTEWRLLRKYSIGWFAAKAESKAFDYLDIFSLPSNDRLAYFPMQAFRGKYFFIPNYPSRKMYGQFYTPRRLNGTVRIIFQGQIAAGRGIEEIIPLLKEKISGRDLELLLRGPCREEYKSALLKLAESEKVPEKISFGLLPYAKLPETSSQCHVGLGILAEKSIMHATVGTASNKLYEYAAVGLPVIYYDNEHFTKHLGQYRWALPAELSAASIRKVLEEITASYEDLSLAARNDFLSSLNYENVFSGVKAHLTAVTLETADTASQR